MNVLIIGSGGREHAMAWKIKQSPKLNNLYVAPGNAGTDTIASNLAIQVLDFKELETTLINKDIDLVVVGPEEPLVKGITDFIKSNPLLKKVKVVGPSAIGAQLEGSKDFAKQFMLRNNIPTAGYFTAQKENLSEALHYLSKLNAPYVLKADGLAAGKGVLILQSLEEAKNELDQMLSGKFGAAGNKVVIEEFLSGIELSVFVLTDGTDYVILPEAKDYKRIGVGDTGLNTGGMGAVSPVPFADKLFLNKIEERIIKPTIAGINKERIDYCGFIFFGLIKVNNEPYVIEYNVRMGDPETEAVLPRIKNDFLEILYKTATKDLKSSKMETIADTCVGVVMASGGYPGEFEKGLTIENLEQINKAFVFHAGTKKQNEHIMTNGGRVLVISALGKDIKEASDKSFAAAEKINYTGKYFRNDIGFDLI